MAAGGAVRDVPIGASGASVAYAREAPELAQLAAAEPEQIVRLAWCRAFSVEEGAGVLVDLQSKSEFCVRRAQLRVSDELDAISDAERCLFRGEFVEYELKRESAGGGGEADAARGLRVVRVQGIEGWPLMFEAAFMLRQEQRARGAARP